MTPQKGLLISQIQPTIQGYLTLRIPTGCWTSILRVLVYCCEMSILDQSRLIYVWNSSVKKKRKKWLYWSFPPTSANKWFPSIQKILSFPQSVVWDVLAVQSEEACSVVTCAMDISRELQAVVKPVLYMNPNLVVVANSFSQGLHINNC